MIYFDGMCICAENEEENDQIMEKVMDRAKANNFQFNQDKIQYRKVEIKFKGHILSEEKIKADFKYRDAILKMKRPKSKTDILRFMGFLKYLAKFIPNSSKQTAELRQLTRNDSESLLQVVSSEPILAVYDPKLPVIVQTDASKDGLGYVIDEVTMNLQRLFMFLRMTVPHMTVVYKPGKEMLDACLEFSCRTCLR